MGRIVGIRAINFGRLKKFELGRVYDLTAPELENFVVVIGPTSSGKSTLFDLFKFVQDCLMYNVVGACDMNNRGGYEQIISQGATGGIEITFRYVGSRSFLYSFRIEQDSNGIPYVTDESLFDYEEQRAVFWTKGGEGPFFDPDNHSKTTIQIEDKRILYLATLGTGRKYDCITELYDCVLDWFHEEFDINSMRKEQTYALPEHLINNGLNLGSVLFRLQGSEKFSTILQQVQSAFPDVTQIKVDLDSTSNQCNIEFGVKGLNQPIPASRVQKSLLLFVAYCTVLFGTSYTGIFMESPDEGFYFSLHEKIVFTALDALKKDEPKQVFFTTNSPFLINALKPKYLWILSTDENGFSVAKSATRYDFVCGLWKEGAKLGDLWCNGFLD